MTSYKSRRRWSPIALLLGVALGGQAGCVSMTCSELLPCSPKQPVLMGLNVDVVDMCHHRRELALVMSDASKATDLRLISTDPDVLRVEEWDYCSKNVRCFLLEGQRPGRAKLVATTSRTRYYNSDRPQPYERDVSVVKSCAEP
jgi:hypothetical protein